MSEKFETKDGKVILYENGTATVVDVKELEAEKVAIEARIGADKPISDKDLLTWAKANYPTVDHSKEVELLDKVNTILEACK